MNNPDKPQYYKHADCDKAIMEGCLDDACDGCRYWPDKPPANQGDNVLALDCTDLSQEQVQRILIWSKACCDRQLAERLQQILDSPEMQREESPTNRSQRARNILRNAIRDIIKQLMP